MSAQPSSTEPVQPTPNTTPETSQTEQEATPSQGASLLGAETKPQEVEQEPQAEPKSSAPEKYEDFKLPEGVQFDQPVLDEFKVMAKELGLSQESAQKLIDLNMKNAAGWQKTATDQWVNQTNQWAETFTKDVDFGGNNLNDSLERAKRALGAFGSPDLTKYLKETGIGNHPELLKMLVRVDRAAGDGRLVDGNSGAQQKPDAAKLLFNVSSKT